MANDPNDIAYEFTPQEEGAFLYGIPQRDLTQADFDALDPWLQRNAITPHPIHGTPLYTKVGTSGEPPKWFQAKQVEAGEGVVIEPLLPGETKAQYEERIAALEAASAPDVPAETDGDA